MVKNVTVFIKCSGNIPANGGNEEDERTNRRAGLKILAESFAFDIRNISLRRDDDYL